MVPQRFASFLLISWIGFVSGYASAQQFKDELTIPESYPKDYLFALLSGNQPVGNSRNELETHLKTPGISYHHRLAHPWVVSVGYRPQSFIKREDQQPMSLLSVSNSTQRIVRLYHPVYFLIGTEILYLIPVLKLNPPLAKDPDFATEIGVGGRASLWFLLGQKSIVALDFERWRGTKTNQLHGISLTLGLAWGL